MKTEDYIGYDEDMNPLVIWQTDTSQGHVVARAIAYMPEPENGFPGGWMLRSALCREAGNRWGLDIKDDLPIEDQWELVAQAEEEWNASREAVSISLSDRA